MKFSRLFFIFLMMLSNSAALNAVGFQTDPKSCSSLRRGVPFPKFDHYSVTHTFVKDVKIPRIRSSLQKKYRTQIRVQYAGKANFADHFVFIRWGCGTGCHQFVIADKSTGQIFDSPFQVVDFHYPTSDGEDPQWKCFNDFFLFQKESSLLVLEGCLDGKRCGRHFYEMKNDGLHEIQYDPDLLMKEKIL